MSVCSTSQCSPKFTSCATPNHFLSVVFFSHTFADLGEIVTKSDFSRPLPDFWLRRRNGERNCVTSSGVWWEWQRPAIRILDAMKKQQGEGEMKGVRIKTVIKTGEYVIVLVKKDKEECELPVGASSHVLP